MGTLKHEGAMMPRSVGWTWTTILTMTTRMNPIIDSLPRTLRHQVASRIRLPQVMLHNRRDTQPQTILQDLLGLICLSMLLPILLEELIRLEVPIQVGRMPLRLVQRILHMGMSAMNMVIIMELQVILMLPDILAISLFHLEITEQTPGTPEIHTQATPG